MSQMLEAVRRNRLDHEKQSLEALNAHIADLERAHAGAVDAYQTARAVMDDLAAVLDDARSRQRLANSRIDQLIESIRREAVKKLPADVLLQIFDQATSLDKSDDFGIRAHELGQSTRVALILSAVCSQWRRAALNHAPLWSWICLHYDEHSIPQASQLELVNLLLQRSRLSSLHIHLVWSTFHKWHAYRVAQDILQVLSVHAARWREFILSAPWSQEIKGVLRIFKGPLPLLQDASIIIGRSDTPVDSVDDNYLPFAPKLNSLRICGAQGFVPLLTGRWGALRYLSITAPLPFAVIWGLVNTAAATLESLVIALSKPPSDVFVFSPLLLPKLKSLNLVAGSSFDRFVSTLQLPQLEHVRIHGVLLCYHSYWQPLLERHAPTITRLSLIGEITANTLRAAKCLTRLRSLTIDSVDTEGAIFADKQLWVDEALWPALSSVRLSDEAHNVVTRDGRMLPFIRWRTEQLGAHGPADRRPTRLKEFILGDPHAPQWLRAEIERLIAAGVAAEQDLPRSHGSS
ncbi:hypothetical protein AURDEDRAFT_159138 [Auricularia subglabra TFB-10046 SS5]|nr:hypothetical protein AURDEDRAFT_159138 [Auricularia subglabra TFB-10046 SS5]